MPRFRGQWCMACCMWDYGENIWQDMSFISRHFPKEVKFPSSSHDITQRQLGSKDFIYRDDFCPLFDAWQKSSIETVHVIGRTGLLCQTKSLLHLSRPGLLCDLRGRWWKRAYVCYWAEYVLTTAFWEVVVVALICSAHRMFFLKPTIEF